MQIVKSRKAAKSVIDELDIADYDEEYEYYQALLGDELFCAASYLYEQAEVYANHEDACEADREARDVHRRSAREHAQRVRQEVDA